MNHKAIFSGYDIVAIIPARGGSVGIPRKNILPYFDKPLIYWSIQQALRSKYIHRVYVTTDDEDIQKIAIECGALAPFLRPKEISGNFAVDFEFMEHFLVWSKENNEKIPDLLVQLRPTSPNRTTENIDDCISKFLPVINYFDCIRSVSLTSKTPYKTYTIDEYSNELVPLFRSLPNIKEPINSPRQILPTTYIHNGYIDVIKSTTILQKQSITGDRIYPYVMDSKDLDDIDTPDD